MPASQRPGNGDRKERVLHTRISERLADDIRQAAEELRVPVSNLVRNVLEEAFGALERVSGDVGDLLEELVGEAERARDRMARFRESREGRAPRERAHPRERGDRVRDSAPYARTDDSEPEFADVVAWQGVVVEAAQPCRACERRLARGDRAFLGIASSGGAPRFLCSACLEARTA